MEAQILTLDASSSNSEAMDVVELASDREESLDNLEKELVGESGSVSSPSSSFGVLVEAGAITGLMRLPLSVLGYDRGEGVPGVGFDLPKVLLRTMMAVTGARTVAHLANLTAGEGILVARDSSGWAEREI